MQAVDNGDHFVIVEGSEYTTASQYTKNKNNSSLRKMAGIKAIHSLVTIKMIEQEQQDGKRFEPTMKIYTGINRYVLVCNPVPTKLVFLDMINLSNLMEFDLPNDIDDYALHGNDLALLINETV